MFLKLNDLWLRWRYPKVVPGRLYDVPVPADVELRFASKVLEKVSAKVNFPGGVAPMGASGRNVLVHEDAAKFMSREQFNACLAHELAHVEQFRRWGFFGVGLLCKIGCKLWGYAHCPVEREAWRIAVKGGWVGRNESWAAGGTGE